MAVKKMKKTKPVKKSKPRKSEIIDFDELEQESERALFSDLEQDEQDTDSEDY